MSRVYYVKWFDQVLGTIEVPNYIFKVDNDYNKLLPSCLNFDGSSPNAVRLFLESRVPKCKDRSVRCVINNVGYSDSNLMKILDETFGMCLNDFIWIVPKERIHLDFHAVHVSRNQFMWAKIFGLFKEK